LVIHAHDDVAFLQAAALAGLSFSTAAMRTPRGSKERVKVVFARSNGELVSPGWMALLAYS